MAPERSEHPEDRNEASTEESSDTGRTGGERPDSEARRSQEDAANDSSESASPDQSGEQHGSGTDRSTVESDQNHNAPEGEEREVVFTIDSSEDLIAREGQSVTEPVSPVPSPEPLNISVATTAVIDHLHQDRDSVETVARPVSDTTGVAVTVSGRDQIERVDETVSNVVRPVQREMTPTVATTNKTSLTEEPDQVHQSVTPSKTTETASQQTEPEELFETTDPVFAWGGGTPYGTKRPMVVLHVQDTLPTLPWLHRTLRDTYRELIGGEPDAKQVETIANEPRIPTVQGSIVTLDLTQGGWKPTVEDGKARIENNDIDIIPSIKETATELFTGDLGYLVVSVPADWKDPLQRPDFFQRLRETIAGQPPASNREEASPTHENVGDGNDVGQPQDENNLSRSTATLSQVKTAPVVSARQREVDPDQFYSRVARYFCLRPDSYDIGQSARADPQELPTGRPDLISPAEQLADSILRRNDWRRIALTESHFSETESDEHYLWKAAIAEGIAYQWYRTHREALEITQYEDFDEFYQERVLAAAAGNTSDTLSIRTEVELTGSGDGDGAPVADVLVSLGGSQSGLRGGLQSFLDDVSVTSPRAAIEYETGAGQGGTNFRSVRQTVKKYEQVSEPTFVAVVLPPRIIYRGRKRAEMVCDLVERHTDDRLSMHAYVPELSRGRCRRLRLLRRPPTGQDHQSTRTEGLLRRLYRVNND